MSIFSSPQSARTAVSTTPDGRDRGEGHPPAGEAIDQQEWDEFVAREAMHHEVVEASFDRAEAYERLGDFQQALEWLDRAAGLGGGLPPAYQAKRARWERAAALRPQPATGGRENGFGGEGQGRAGSMTEPESRGSAEMGAADTGEHFVLEVAATPEAASAVRRAFLAQDGALPNLVRDDVLLLLTELVNNAVGHADTAPGPAVRVEIGQWFGMVRVAVWDEGRGFTYPTTSRSDETGGWGLVLVDRIADRWAVAPAPTGTRVWFEIRYDE